MIGIGAFGRPSPTTQNPGVETEIIQEEVEDDAQTKFYKQHMVKSQPPEMSDRLTARDFDSWASSKITESFQHQQYIKSVIKDRKEDEEQTEARGIQYGVAVFMGCIIICINFYYQNQHDRLHETEMKKHREKKS